jgi:biotin synthase
MSDETQALCFLAETGSIFVGEKLLTTPNPEQDRDAGLFRRLGISARDLSPVTVEPV